ncbi:MAG: hypothetical protein WAX69_10340 [Victivallales bacterium]
MSTVKPMCFMISTEKVGGVVLLRIDDVKEWDVVKKDLRADMLISAEETVNEAEIKINQGTPG